MYKFLIGFDYKLKYSPGRCSGFQVTGMMKGFIWVWNLWFWDFLGRIICQVFFMLEIMFWGCYDNLKIYSSALTVYFCDVQTGMCCCWCLGKCLVKGFFGVVVGSPRDVFGFCFLPQLDHPCHLKSWVPPPLGCLHACVLSGWGQRFFRADPGYFVILSLRPCKKINISSGNDDLISFPVSNLPSSYWWTRGDWNSGSMFMCVPSHLFGGVVKGAKCTDHKNRNFR